MKQKTEKKRLKTNYQKALLISGACFKSFIFLPLWPQPWSMRSTDEFLITYFHTHFFSSRVHTWCIYIFRLFPKMPSTFGCFVFNRSCSCWCWRCRYAIKWQWNNGTFYTNQQTHAKVFFPSWFKSQMCQ